MSVRREQLTSRVQRLGAEYQSFTNGDGVVRRMLRAAVGGQSGWVNREYARRYGRRPSYEKVLG